MKIALLRVGIDTGSGGMHGPLYQDGTFEYIPIPDDRKIDERTYGNTTGRHGIKLVEYFPSTWRARYRDESMHFDPEFKTFTYGDPSPLKAKLSHLEPEDLLVFYCGLKGFDFDSPPQLYIMGFFEVLISGYPKDIPEDKRKRLLGKNFHILHNEVYESQKDTLIVVKGTSNSRLLEKAKCISVYGKDAVGHQLKILSPKMQKIFGDFDGKLSFQRNPTRWVHPDYIKKAREFVLSLT
jgi:Nucleotide modification associated domain 3